VPGSFNSFTYLALVLGAKSGFVSFSYFSQTSNKPAQQVCVFPVRSIYVSLTKVTIHLFEN